MTDDGRYRLEPLDQHHVVGEFACEEDDFGEYLRDEAIQDIEKGFALTFVEIDITCDVSNNIAGFFTLRAHADRIKDDEGGEPIEVPLVELLWLARDLRWRGQRVGDILLLDALAMVAQVSRYVGFIGLHLRSTGNGKRLYERNHFLPFDQHIRYDGIRYILPIAFIREIADSLE